jgi:hypothetical protein
MTEIKSIVFDIISITTIWGLINCTNDNCYKFYINSKYVNLGFEYNKTYLILLGTGVSGYILSKYV